MPLKRISSIPLSLNHTFVLHIYIIHNGCARIQNNKQRQQIILYCGVRTSTAPSQSQITPRPHRHSHFTSTLINYLETLALSSSPKYELTLLSTVPRLRISKTTDEYTLPQAILMFKTADVGYLCAHIFVSLVLLLKI